MKKSTESRFKYIGFKHGLPKKIKYDENIYSYVPIYTLKPEEIVHKKLDRKN